MDQLLRNTNINKQIIPVRIQNKKMQTPFSSDPSFLSLGNYTVCFNQLLGKGTTGTVYRGFDNLTRLPVAVKVIDLVTIKDDATRMLLDNQKMALGMVENANVVQLKDIIQQDGRCFIVTELCQGETLREFIQRRGKLTEDESMNIFRGVLAGCLAITQSCVIHRDLKPANIIVSPSLTTKIIDFGFCQVIRAKKVMRTFNVGSPSYMSPEAYLRTLYSEKSDSWSLGMILFEMLHGRTLDQGQNIKEYFEILKKNPNYISQFAAQFSDNVREILEKSLKYLPEERMSISTMKYSADLHHLKRARIESTSLSCTQPQQQVSFKSLKGPSLPPKPLAPLTLHNISTQSNTCPNGFISFADFSKPQPQPQPRYNNKTSQISLSSSSNKDSSVQQSIGRSNENYQFLANKIPQQVQVPFEAYQSLSSKDIIERRPRGPPVFRQVTVRYL